MPSEDFVSLPVPQRGTANIVESENAVVLTLADWNAVSWNYRVTRERFADQDDALHSLREVYYTDDGVVRGWTKDAIAPRGDSLAECVAEYTLMAEAFTRPVLDVTDEDHPFEVTETGPESGHAGDGS